MSLTRRLRTMLFCCLLEFGILGGAPVRPEQIRELMEGLNQPKLAQVLPAAEEPGDD